MPRRSWDWVERAVTSDASGLAALGTVSLIRAYSYLPWQVNTDREPAHWLEGLMPTTGWAVAWLIIGLACITAIWWRRIMPAAVGLIAGLNFAWFLSFLGLWVVGESSRGYVSALNYGLVFVLVIWGFGRGRNPEVVVKLDKE